MVLWKCVSPKLPRPALLSASALAQNFCPLARARHAPFAPAGKAGGTYSSLSSRACCARARFAPRRSQCARAVRRASAASSSSAGRAPVTQRHLARSSSCRPARDGLQLFSREGAG